MLLSILKIIGIIILVILAIILFILLSLLLIPIKYEGKGSYKEKPDADIKVTWFPVLLKVIASYHEDELVYIIKLLGGVIMTNTDAKISFLGKKLFSEKTAVDHEGDSDKNNDDVIESEITSSTKREQEENKADITNPLLTKEAVSRNKKKKIAKKRISFFEKIRRTIENIKNKITRFIDNLRRINQKKDDLLKVYHSKRFEKAKKDVIIYIKKLIRVIKPRKLQGYIHFGMKDPASTGEIAGILAMFLPLYDGYFQVVPEFEHACFDGNVYMKGKIRIISILIIGLKIIFNKNLIKVMKRVQTIIER
ncbi:MAG: DUF2953 domain-containing protein [Lachnospiraceae bacterium]